MLEVLQVLMFFILPAAICGVLLNALEEVL